jgi:hypothetical protein
MSVIQSRQLCWLKKFTLISINKIQFNETVRTCDHLSESNCLSPGADGRIILRWIFRKWDVRAWTGSMCLRVGKGGGHLCMGNETLGSIKCGDLLD